MGDVEFLVGPEHEPVPGDDAAGDEVDLNPRRLPRWVVVTGAVAAAALVVAALVTRGSSRPDRAVAEQTSAPSSAPSSAPASASASPTRRGGLPPLPTSPVDRVLRDGDQIALDVALAGNILYTLRYDTLSTTDALHGTVISRVRVSGLDYYYGGPTMHLALDPSSFTAWVFTQQVSPPRILEIDSVSLQRRRSLVAPGTIYGAATMNGRLFLATAAGVAVVAPGGRPRVLPRTKGLIASITADPARNRLIAVDSSSPQHLLTISPDGTVEVVATVAPLVSPSLAVADGQIWLAGSADAGDAVVRLDPTSLLPVARSEVSQRAGAGVRVAPGDRVVWVSSGGGLEAQQLWCVDARTGAVGSYWPGMSGAVSSRAGLAYAVRGGQVVGLPSGPGCPG